MNFVLLFSLFRRNFDFSWFLLIFANFYWLLIRFCDVVMKNSLILLMFFNVLGGSWFLIKFCSFWLIFVNFHVFGWFVMKLSCILHYIFHCFGEFWIFHDISYFFMIFSDFGWNFHEKCWFCIVFCIVFAQCDFDDNFHKNYDFG